MRRVGILVFALALGVAASSGTLAGGAASDGVDRGTPIKTRVLVSGYSYIIMRGEVGYWQGSLKSDAEPCLYDRKVVMFRKRDGRDRKLGSGFTPGDDNSWEVGAPTPKGGVYYAKAKRARPCLGGRSKNFNFPQDQPLR